MINKRIVKIMVTRPWSLQEERKEGRWSCISTRAGSSNKQDGRSWVNVCLLLNGSQSIPMVLSWELPLVLKLSILLGRNQADLGWAMDVDYLRNALCSLGARDLQVTLDWVPYWGGYCWFLCFVFLRIHIIMGEESKAEQASINVPGRRVIFKGLGTMVVIKAFDLF